MSGRLTGSQDQRRGKVDDADGDGNSSADQPSYNAEEVNQARPGPHLAGSHSELTTGVQRRGSRSTILECKVPSCVERYRIMRNA